MCKDMLQRYVAREIRCLRARQTNGDTARLETCASSGFPTFATFVVPLCCFQLPRRDCIYLCGAAAVLFLTNFLFVL